MSASRAGTREWGDSPPEGASRDNNRPPPPQHHDEHEMGARYCVSRLPLETWLGLWSRRVIRLAARLSENSSPASSDGADKLIHQTREVAGTENPILRR